MKTALLLISLLICFLVTSSLDYQDMQADDCRAKGRVYNPQDSTCEKPILKEKNHAPS